ncbi:class I SAM-dependent methyltransferase [Rhodoferax antarcticus]|uniref:class I SAM-dependent methyltransferase n=1 Tax=Rhodoferax antarcticus TaxID=81479 RepID=UPI00138FE5C4|nr:methyltransferase domain-containing protein [Rhodoferax antarcticus]
MSDEFNVKPTIIVDQYEAASKTSGTAQNYNGLAIHALPGLHEFIFSKVEEIVSSGSRVLELAAGSGAMSLRLKNHGFQVTATDYVSSNFRLHGSIPFFEADLNGNFSLGYEEMFDAIVATEIIEHLENPRHFSRQCFKMLKNGGKIIFSTPNIDSAASIVSHIRCGTYQWFSDADYAHDGHITPLMQWQIDKCFTEAGFEFVYKGSFGDPYERFGGSPRLVLFSKFINRISALKEELKKQIFVAAAEKH